MKKIAILWVLMFVLSGVATLAGCSSDKNDSLPEIPSVPVDSVKTSTDKDSSTTNTNNSINIWDRDLIRKSGHSDNNEIVIKKFERSGINLQVVDATDRFESAVLYGKNIPVNHVNIEQLPSAIREMATNYSIWTDAVVCKMEYDGECYYDVYYEFSSSLFHIYNSQGEHLFFQDTGEYRKFVSRVTNVCCVLVLIPEVVKSAEGAPNYLVGYWQNDWQHLVAHDNMHYTVALYSDLNFSITEVMALNDDGTGYLRTVKTYKNGTNEVALDPFRYVLTDYHGGEQYNYHGYYYKCYFAAGDTIEYLVRSYDGMQSLFPDLCLAVYPWFRQTEDHYQSLSVNAGQKYGNPGKDGSSPIVGQWTGDSFSWVFRRDNTGYRLYNGKMSVPFAYTVSYNGSEAELTIYKYNCGFVVDDGFAKDIYSDFDPTVLPKGKVIKATVSGNTLKLNGWGTYQRVYRP